MTKEFNSTWDKYYKSVLYKNFGGEPYLVLEDGTEVFRKDVEDRYTFFDYYDDKISGGFFDNHPTPYIIATGAGTIPQIEDMMLTVQEREKILAQGLCIYFYEIMWYHAGLPKKFLISDIDKYVPDDFNFEIDGHDFFCFDLDCVRVFMHKNNIPSVNVVVRDYGIGKFVSEKYPKIKITYRENYISTLAGSSDVQSSFDLARDMFRNLQSESIQHKFWCGNWRYAGHRHLVAAFLSRLDTKLSWAYKINIEDSTYWPILDEWRLSDPNTHMKIKWGAEILNTNGPFVLDVQTSHTPIDGSKLFYVPNVRNNSYTCPTLLPLPFKDYTECFCAVVTESEFRRPSANISEKIINAVKACRPFVLVSSPYSLEWFRRLGFKTFDKLWSEAYDAENDHAKRLQMIFNVIEYIDSKSIDELKQMYESVRDILEYNFQHLDNLRNIHACDL